MTGSELRGDEPGVYPVVFRGVKEVGLLERFDETGVEHIDAVLMRREAQHALQVSGEMAGVTAGRLKAEADVSEMMLLHECKNPLLESKHAGLVIGHGESAYRFGGVTFGKATDDVILAANIDPDKQDVGHGNHLLCCGLGATVLGCPWESSPLTALRAIGIHRGPSVHKPSSAMRKGW
ncbi:hypothetical protein ABEV74_09205 [Paenibacillus cisolokensis]